MDSRARHRNFKNSVVFLGVFTVFAAGALSGEKNAAEVVTAADSVAGKSVGYSPFARGGKPGKPFAKGRDHYMGGEKGSRSLYFGDTHVHTSYSADAAFMGATLGPEEAYRVARGEEVISSAGLAARLGMPHNGNLSNGLMFDDVTFTTRKPISAGYAARRQRYEPLYEVTRMKGDGEAHPALSPDDEFADFETWDVGGINSIEPKTPAMLPWEYARTALTRGLHCEQSLGVNPFKFGLVGSTDTHTAISGTYENNYFGKVVPLEPANSHERFYEIVAGRRPSPGGQDLKVYAWQTSASGLVGVWAEENTRAALWDAMKRREVFATTGTRLQFANLVYA